MKKGRKFLGMALAVCMMMSPIVFPVHKADAAVKMYTYQFAAHSMNVKDAGGSGEDHYVMLHSYGDENSSGSFYNLLHEDAYNGILPNNDYSWFKKYSAFLPFVMNANQDIYKFGSVSGNNVRHTQQFDSTKPPWMIQGFSFIYNNNNDYCCGELELVLPDVDGAVRGTKYKSSGNLSDLVAENKRIMGSNSNGAYRSQTGSYDYIGFAHETTGVWFSKDRMDDKYALQGVTVDVSDETQRKITDVGIYDDYSASEEYRVALNSKTGAGGTYNWGLDHCEWDKTMIDQYGTYNPLDLADAPSYTVSCSDSNFDDLIRASEYSSSWKTIYKPQDVYNKMIESNIHKVTVTTTLKYPARSTALTDAMKAKGWEKSGDSIQLEKTTVFYAETYQLGTAAISGGQATGYGRTYFNQKNRELKITIPVASIINYTNHPYGLDRWLVAQQFKCTAKLYAGDKEVKDENGNVVAVTKGSSGNNITFTATIPNNVQYSDYVRLALSGIRLDGYDFACTENTSVLTSKTFSFNSYYIDTKAPTATLTGISENLSDSPVPARDLVFTLAASDGETIYSEQTGHNNLNQNMARYALLDSAGTPLDIKMGTATAQNGEVLYKSIDRIDITAPDVESECSLIIRGYDEAGNPINGYDGKDPRYFRQDGIMTDKKAPRVSLSTNQSARDVAGQMTVSCTFDITDMCTPEIKDGLWSRVYYCFLENGQTLPSMLEESNQPAKSGGIDTLWNKWMYVDNTETASPAVTLLLEDGQEFDGALYYCTEDCVGFTQIGEGNHTIGSPMQKTIKALNTSAEDIRIKDTSVTDPDKPLNAHTIKFDLQQGGSGWTVRYQWQPDGAVADEDAWTEYTGKELDAVSELNDGTPMKGRYTLYYEVENTVSEAQGMYSQSYYFDNAAPAVTVNFDGTTPNLSSGNIKNVYVTATDDTDIDSGSYSVFNRGGGVVSGLQEVPLSLTADAVTGKQKINEVVALAMPADVGNGLYEIQVTVADSNGNNAQADPVTFLWRSSAPALSVTDNAEQKIPEGIENAGASFVRDAADYQITANVQELFANGDASYPQYVTYRYSVNDGETWSKWTKADSAMDMDGSGSVSFTPELKYGLSRIVVQAVALDASETETPLNDNSLIAQCEVFRVYYENQAIVNDYKDGTIEWTYNTAKTNQAFDATLTVTDNAAYQLDEFKVYEVVTDSEGKETLEELAVTGEASPFRVTIAHNGTYRAVAVNDFGYTWSKQVEIYNINTDKPKLVSATYSTTQPTANGVRVKLAFNKDDISILSVESAEETALETGAVTIQGSNTLFVTQNANLLIRFRDAFGNEGVNLGNEGETENCPVTISNIVKEPPRLVPVVSTSSDMMTAQLYFRLSNLELDKYTDPFNRKLEDFKAFHNGRQYDVAVTDGNGAYQPVVFEFRDNGRYSFKVYDALGNTQEVSVEITGIDKAAPVITGVTITYSLADGQKETIKHTPGPEAGWVFANDKYATTNQNVTVTVTTDKDTVLKGEADSDTITDEDYDTENSKEYSANGLFNFNLQAKNGIISNYGVDIELIDKTPPTIAFDGSQELVFIEDMTAGQDESLTYSSKKLLDYHAFDVYKGVETDLTEQVTIDYGTFNKDDITKNTFDRNKPYTIIYRVADSAGNVTEIRRTVRLVGKYDTILLINDKMPSSDGTADAEGGTFTMKLKNFSGTAYARVAQGWYTMGQMKTEGTMLSAKNGVYTLSNLTQGWYTVFVQTDKRDYFTYWIFVNGTK